MAPSVMSINYKATNFLKWTPTFYNTIKHKIGRKRVGHGPVSSMGFLSHQRPRQPSVLLLLLYHPIVVVVWLIILFCILAATSNFFWHASSTICFACPCLFSLPICPHLHCNNVVTNSSRSQPLFEQDHKV